LKLAQATERGNGENLAAAASYLAACLGVGNANFLAAGAGEEVLLAHGRSYEWKHILDLGFSILDWNLTAQIQNPKSKI
jgi:K+-transporting ATPase A subunit